MRVIWTDPVTGRRAYVVIDRLVGGMSGGGIRMREGVTMEEVERLARVMSYKNGAANVPGGGAKAGLDCDPHSPNARPMLTRFVRAMRPLLNTYWGSGEDLGTSQPVLNEIFAEAGMPSTSGPVVKWTGDPEANVQRQMDSFAVIVHGESLGDSIGGFGVAEAAAAAAEYLGWQLNEMTAAIQGFGAMGGSSTRYLASLGVKIVAVADVNHTFFNPSGLDVEALLSTRTRLGDIDGNALRPSDQRLSREEWLELECDIVVPAAVPDAINIDNCNRVAARLVVEAANIPTTEEAQQQLHDRGVVVIPDFVANAGAVAWFWGILLDRIQPTAEDAFAKVAKNIRDAVKNTLELSEHEHITPRRAAEMMAMRNLESLVSQFGEETAVLAG